MGTAFQCDKCGRLQAGKPRNSDARYCTLTPESVGSHLRSFSVDGVDRENTKTPELCLKCFVALLADFLALEQQQLKE